MFIIHFVLNLLIVAIELALAAGAGWFAWQMPIIFSAFTAGLALVLGFQLELRRLAFEAPFYFERSSALARLVRALLGGGQAIFKAVIGGLVALMTFSGTGEPRLFIVAALFAACALVGSTILRRLTISFGARPTHWGFFRMAAPLGLLFSAAMSLFPPPSSLDVARQVLLDLPVRPTIAQAGEALFSVRLWVDDLIVRILASHIGPEWAKVVGIVIGSNILAGFVIAIYAVVLSEIVRILEEAHWLMRGHRRIRG